LLHHPGYWWNRLIEKFGLREPNAQNRDRHHTGNESRDGGALCAGA